MSTPTSLVFHACSIKHNGIADRIVTPVKLCQAFDPKHPPDPPHPLHDTNALWDTGATKSVITDATVAALNLVPVGTTMVNHAGGSSPSNTYLVNFLLPNKVGIAGVMVSQCSDIAGHFGAIIGMDIICRGDFSITNVGNETCMSFRIPSIKTVDYVEEANRLKGIPRLPKVGRNDPCPCGSGKKYKKCHGR
jgi:hypothetical protein